MLVQAYTVVTEEPTQLVPGVRLRWRRLVTLSESEAAEEAKRLGGYYSPTWVLVIDKMIWPLQPPLLLGPREGRGDLL